MNKYLLPLAAAAMLAGTSLSLAATTISSNFTAKIKIDSKCIFVGGAIADMNFGTDTFLDAAVPGSTSFQFRCSKNSGYAITLTGADGTSAAGNGSANVTSNMVFSGDEIRYTAKLELTGLLDAGATQSVTITGNVPALAAADPKPQPGTYTDTLTVNITY